MASSQDIDTLFQQCPFSSNPNSNVINHKQVVPSSDHDYYYYYSLDSSTFNSAPPPPIPSFGSSGSLLPWDVNEDAEYFSFEAQTSMNPNQHSHSSGVELMHDHDLCQQIPTIPTHHQAQTPNSSSSSYISQPPEYQNVRKVSDDGYSWRKYGQKQIKASTNPRSYYKCTFPNCVTKKKVEQNLDGHATQIVYRGRHNHPKPPLTHPSLFNRHPPYNLIHQNAPISHDPINAVLQPSSSGYPQNDGDMERQAKRWKGESVYHLSSDGNSTIKEPQLVVKTTSEVDILDDGYKWRKYGQKSVKGNLNPRSYYRCTFNGCPVRKHVERSTNDSKTVITTYEGKHNHDVPAQPYAKNAPTRPSPVSNQMSSGLNFVQIQSYDHQATAQNQNFPGYGSSVGVYANQLRRTENALSALKEECIDDYIFNSFVN